MNKQLKRRVKKNIWDNWKGYEGNRKVYDFGTDESAAQEWVNGGELPKFNPEDFKGNIRSASISEEQVNKVLTESGPWSLEQANEMAKQLLGVEDKKLGQFIWDTIQEPDSLQAITKEVNKALFDAKFFQQSVSNALSN